MCFHLLRSTSYSRSQEILHSIFIQSTLRVTEHESPLGNIPVAFSMWLTWELESRLMLPRFVQWQLGAKSSQLHYIHLFEENVWKYCMHTPTFTPYPYASYTWWISNISCDGLFVSTARSHHGLYMKISLLLKLMSLASVSLREIKRKFQIAQNNL